MKRISLFLLLMITLLAFLSCDDSTGVPYQAPSEAKSVSITGGAGSGTYSLGAVVQIVADAPGVDSQFVRWDGNGTSLLGTGYDYTSPTLTFLMINSPIILTATYGPIAGIPTVDSFQVTVDNGSGSGRYPALATVNVVANTSDTTQRFTYWSGNGASLLQDASTVSSSFTMPSYAVGLTPNYETITVDPKPSYTFSLAATAPTPGVPTAKVGETVAIEVLGIAPTTNSLRYHYKSKSTDSEWFSSAAPFFSAAYYTVGTYTMVCYIYDETADVYSNVKEISFTITSDVVVDTGLADDGVPANLPIHTGIIASTFWVGEWGSDANHGISNVPSAWDSDWGGKFGVEDYPGLARDSDFIPTDSRYKKSENPYYVALPYNDYSNIVYDGEANASSVSYLKSDYITEYSADYGRNIVVTTALGSYKQSERKSSVTSIPWYDAAKGNWGSRSLVKGRWVRVRYNGSAWVYAQWMDAGPYHYDDADYVFGSSAPRNASSSTGDDPYAGIDLSPSIFLKLGVSLEWGGANISGVEWQFVNAKDVPDGPWRRYVSDANTNW